ncbi:MAG: hypothetical protein RLZZ324_349 [Candidatus Parcubacteria bacterium]|jgi:hypothetical protein
MRKQSLITMFVVMAVGTALLFRYATPPAPEKAVGAAFSKLANAEHLAGLVTVATSAGANPITLHGAFKFDLPPGGVSSGEATFTTVGEGGGQEIVVDSRAVDGDLYFNAKNLPAGKIGDVSLAQVGGAWWKLDRATLGSFMDVRAGIAPKAKVGGNAGAAWTALRDLALGGSMFVTDGGAQTEIVGRVMTYKMVLGVKREAAKAFAAALREAMLGQSLSSADAAAIRDAAADVTARVTAWVDPRAGKLLQMQIDLEGTGGAQSIMLTALDTDTVAGTRAPEDAKSFDDLARTLFMKPSADAGAAKTAPTKATPKPATASPKKK